MEKDEGKIVWVRISDIDKNPFRKYSVYAIQRDKVDKLKESIHKTGFWKTVTGRYSPDPTKAGRVEIAFGHHRIAAALEVYKPEDTIPIIIETLSDDEMRERMIRENKAEYGCLPAAIDDAVKAARDFLDGNREEAEKLLKADRSDVKRVRVGAPAIAKYTGFPKSTVESSLRRLEWTETGKVDREALYLMPNTAAANRFARAVMQHPASQPHQRTIAAYIVKNSGFGTASIELAFREFVPLGPVTDPLCPRFYEKKLAEATRLINKCATSLTALGRLSMPRMFPEQATKEDISALAIEKYHEALDELSATVEMVGRVLDREPRKAFLSEPEVSI